LIGAKTNMGLMRLRGVRSVTAGGLCLGMYGGPSYVGDKSCGVLLTVTDWETRCCEVSLIFWPYNGG